MLLILKQGEWTCQLEGQMRSSCKLPVTFISLAKVNTPCVVFLLQWYWTHLIYPLYDLTFCLYETHAIAKNRGKLKLHRLAADAHALAGFCESDGGALYLFDSCEKTWKILVKCKLIQLRNERPLGRTFHASSSRNIRCIMQRQSRICRIYGQV